MIDIFSMPFNKEDFSKLEQELREHNSQLLLVSKKFIEKPKERSCFGSGSFRYKELESGLIMHPYLIAHSLKERLIDPSLGIMDLVVRQAVDLYTNKKSLDDIISLKEGNIRIITNSYKACFPSYNASLEAYSLLIGDEEVKSFILKNDGRGAEVYDYLSFLLRDENKIKEIKDFKLKKQKEKIIEDLESLLKKEADLIDKIKRDTDRISKNFNDKVFAVLYTSNIREDLDSTRFNIQEVLKKAIAFGMNQDSGKYIIEVTPGKKTEINIGEYISALNSRYAIEESSQHI